METIVQNKILKAIDKALYETIFNLGHIEKNARINISRKDIGDVGTDGILYEYVDLGLESGTLWCKLNLGASGEYEYGDLYQWGSIVPAKNTCNWINTPFLINQSSNVNDFSARFSKYRDKEVLDKEDDAAYNIIGPSWLMPSVKLFEELNNKCTISYIEENGVKGAKVTGPSGKYIFFPLSGYKAKDSICFKNTVGLYLSNLKVKSESSKMTILRVDDHNFVPYSIYYRCFGLSIRPVKIMKNR